MAGYRLQSVGFEQITSLSSAVGLTSSKYLDGTTPKANVVVLCARDQAINFRSDGTNPAATVGITLAVGVPFTYDGNLSTIKFIEATATAKLDVEYYLSGD